MKLLRWVRMRCRTPAALRSALALVLQNQKRSDRSGASNAHSTRQKAVSFLLACALVLGTLAFRPLLATATTCGAGSNIAFADIGGGQCQASITTTGAHTITIPTGATTMTIEVIGGGNQSSYWTSPSYGGGGGEYAKRNNYSVVGLTGIYVFVSSGAPANYYVSCGTTGEQGWGDKTIGEWPQPARSFNARP